VKAPPLLRTIVFLLVVLPVWLPAAQVDYYLKISDIEGESDAKNHKGEIELDSFAWGMRREPELTGQGSKFVVDQIVIKKAIDKSTPRLMLACATGAPVPEVQLIVTRPNPKGTGDPVVFLKITMTDVLVTSYQTGGSSGDVVPVDSFSLNFEKIELEYTPYNRETGEAEGSVSFHYDVTQPPT